MRTYRICTLKSGSPSRLRNPGITSQGFLNPHGKTAGSKPLNQSKNCRLRASQPGHPLRQPPAQTLPAEGLRPYSPISSAVVRSLACYCLEPLPLSFHILLSLKLMADFLVLWCCVFQAFLTTASPCSSRSSEFPLAWLVHGGLASIPPHDLCSGAF